VECKITLFLIYGQKYLTLWQNKIVIAMQVVYEDNHIIIVNKAPGEIVQGDKTGDEPLVETLKIWLKEKYDKPGNVFCGVVHRLDRPVGGLVVFAKTSKAASRLSEQIRNKEFEKEYLVIADGKFEEPTGIYEDYLWKNEKNNISKIVDEKSKNAKIAKLDYKVVKYNEETNLSLVKVKLHTGRHHQIRVQLSGRNHSIYGDQKYGTRGRGKQLCLWAYKLTINHPTTKEKMTFECYPKAEGSWSILKNE